MIFVNSYADVIYGVNEFPEWASLNYTSSWCTVRSLHHLFKSCFSSHLNRIVLLFSRIVTPTSSSLLILLQNKIWIWMYSEDWIPRFDSTGDIESLVSFWYHWYWCMPTESINALRRDSRPNTQVHIILDLLETRFPCSDTRPSHIWNPRYHVQSKNQFNHHPDMAALRLS